MANQQKLKVESVDPPSGPPQRISIFHEEEAVRIIFVRKTKDGKPYMSVKHRFSTYDKWIRNPNGEPVLPDRIFNPMCRLANTIMHDRDQRTATAVATKSSIAR